MGRWGTLVLVKLHAVHKQELASLTEAWLGWTGAAVIVDGLSRTNHQCTDVGPLVHGWPCTCLAAGIGCTWLHFHAFQPYKVQPHSHTATLVALTAHLVSNATNVRYRYS